MAFSVFGEWRQLQMSGLTNLLRTSASAAFCLVCLHRRPQTWARGGTRLLKKGKFGKYVMLCLRKLAQTPGNH